MVPRQRLGEGRAHGEGWERDERGRRLLPRLLEALLKAYLRPVLDAVASASGTPRGAAARRGWWGLRSRKQRLSDCPEQWV